MSKQRMIRDSFWTDSYIEKLSPDEKLIFIYLLTNPLANVAGIYEIRTKRIGFETGYDVEVIETILNRFERDKKLLRHNDWLCLVNHIKNQSLNPSIIEGCRRIFDELPPDVGQAVTGWVQGGLLNLTLLNLTLLNSTKLTVKTVRNAYNKKEVEEHPGFVDFWSKYPKKTGKGEAEKAWIKNRPPLDVVLAAIDAQKKTRQWTTDEGKYIPYPATWLNQKRWEDDPEIKTENKYDKYDK